MTAPPDRLEPPTWHAWKAQNGSKRWYWRYPLAIEWAFEQVNHGLHQWAFVEFLEYAGRFTVLVVAIFWFLEAGDRAKERHYRAWDLINSARGSTGDGGRRDALQDLNKDGVSLAAAPLDQAYLPVVDLKGADLSRVNLSGANLQSANLQGAYLVEADFSGADLRGANLQGAGLLKANLHDARLWGANLWGANLWGANLQGATLWEVHLQGADLLYADLQDARLDSADLSGANLRKANLQGADLLYADLQDARLDSADLSGANLRKASNLTQEQLDKANGDGKTRLPEGLTRPAHWPKTEGPENPPAPQPDDAGRAPTADGAPGSEK